MFSNLLSFFITLIHTVFVSSVFVVPLYILLCCVIVRILRSCLVH